MTSRRWPLIATVSAGALLALVGLVVRGPDAAISALLAAALVAVFFASGAVPLALGSAPHMTRGAGTGLLVTTYVVRLTLVLGVLLVAAATDVLDQLWTGVTLMTCAFVWSLAALAAVIRAVRS